MTTYAPFTVFPVSFSASGSGRLANGSLVVRDAVTDALKNVYSDTAGTSAGNTITLNARGEPTVSGNVVNLYGIYGDTYKFTLFDSAGNTIWTADDVPCGLEGGDELRLFDTMADAIAATNLKAGKAILVKDEASSIWDLTGSGTPNGDNIISLTGSGLVATLRGGADKQYAAQYLQTTSDIINGCQVSIMRFIPRGEHADIYDKTTTTDVSSYWQEALDVANNLYAPRGLYIIGTELTRTHDTTRSPGLIIRGDGQEETEFDNRVANGALLKILQDTSGDFAYGGELQHFGIITSTSPANSNGIEIQASSAFLINSLAITSLTGTGLEIYGDTDPDQCTLFEILRCHITSMGNRGINAAYVASNTLAMYRLAGNRIISCANAGMRLVFANAEVVNNALAQNGSTAEAQMLVHQPGSTNYGLSICRNFFEKGRNGELEIEAAICGEVKLNTFTSNDASSGTFAVKLGHHASGNTRGIVLEGNRHIVNAAIAGTYTCYDFGDRASKCELRKPEYNDISTATKVAMTNTAKAASNYVEDENGIVMIPKPRRHTVVTVNAAGTTTLDYLSSGPAQRVALAATGAHTLVAPIASEGNELDLIIRNESGGAVTVTFGTRFTGITGYTDPTNGTQTSCKFVYDDVSAAFRQVGGWSA